MSESGHSLTPGKPPLFSAKPSGTVLRKILARNFITNGGTVLARRECVMKVGGFNADIVMAQDWELWCKLALNGTFVFAGHDPIIDYRLRSSSVARTAGISPQAQFEAIGAVFDNPAIKANLTTKTLKRLRQKREADASLFVATEALRGGNWVEARRAALSSIRQDKGRIRSWVTLALAATRRLPPAAKERLGVEKPN
jgi:hypothetical protein